MLAACVAVAAVACGAAAEDDGAEIAAAGRHDPIVGSWVGTGTYAAGGEFNMRLTFVSPKGGVSRYPDTPCGGVLVGGRKGDGYEYQETISYNGLEERSDNFCINGLMRLEVSGNSMTYEWSASYNGEDYSSTGKLERAR